ncbi:MAG TPA: hypothetical protein VHY19_13265 [Steroidobacteraceae bacterium]|jgi:uncharacterized membrane protein YgcG|nr:hypothetical protein [Steroidobacteraceae bacterium]
MFHKALISVIFVAALGGAGVATAQLPPTRAADASSQQIYAAASAGKLAEAEQMIAQVLRDYPSSARAHYVAAEVYARSPDLVRARQELHTAEQLSPGLTFARPAAVAALERELGAGRMVPASHGASWGAIVLVLGIGALIYALLRRRAAAVNPYAQPYGTYGANPYGPMNPPYPGGYGPGYGGPGYGAPMRTGSGLMGNLATGLAVGAGVAAGEELIQHAFGSHAGGGIIPSADAAGLPDPGVNGDMGGADFGISDGGSWDSGGGDPFGGGGDMGGGDLGGGGDWT